jgi:aryl-alcohol dehydrogenase-like predicted oxidoreductase
VGEELQQTVFGGTGRRVTRVGLGGEGVLRTFGRAEEAAGVIEEAIGAGTTYFDSARAYSGSEQYLGQVWQSRPEHRRAIFQTSKSAQRSAAAASDELELTLKNLRTEYLDLWQIHDVRSHSDLDRLGASGGALEAFVSARGSGMVKAIGVTGHHDPEVLTRAVREWPVDAVLLPVNPVEAVLGGFLEETVAAAREKAVAVIGMKVLGAGYFLAPGSGVTPELLLRFALARDVDVIIVGCSTPEHVRTLASAVNAPPLDSAEQEGLVEAFRPLAGRLAYYRGVV